MAFLYIAEFQGIGAPTGNVVQSPQVPPITEQRVAIGGGSLASNPFNVKTQIIRINTDAICSIAFGSAAGSTPTAAATTMRLAANQTEYFSVYPGQIVAVITNS
jgi:hypothetical protein